VTGSVSIDIDSLTAAQKSVTELAGVIDSQRAVVTSGTPIALPSLQDGSPLAAAAAWLRDEAPKLQTVIDLATLLDTEGTGSASYEGSGSFSDAEALLGQELGKQVSDMDIDSPEDRERYQHLADLMAKYQDNQGVTTSFLTELGPEGATEAIQKLAAMTANPPSSDYYENVEEPNNPYDESQALGNLQSSFAASLIGMIGSGTTNSWVDSEEWGEGIGQDWDVAAILLRSADKNNTVLGADFTAKLGHELYDYEAGDPQRHQNGAGSMFGNEKFYDENQDALKQLIGAADNSPDSAQGLMKDEEVASYLMHDRLTSEYLVDDMDDLVRVATVDAANDPTGSRAQNAAEISSWTLKYAGENHLDKGYDEELGGIVGTYMPDVYETVTGHDVSDITGRVPPFALDVDKSDLTSVLSDIGRNDTATSIIGDHAMRLNQVLIDHGAQESLDGRASGDPDFNRDTDGDPLMLQIHGAAEFRGYLEDELAHGMTNDGEDEAAARKKTAELFTLPLDFIDTGGLGEASPLGDYLVGDIKDQIIDGYVGDPAHSAAVEGNEHYESARQATTVQAFYALANADSDVAPHGGDLGVEAGPGGGSQFSTELHDDWPKDTYGNMVPPGELSESQIKDLLSQHSQDAGVTGATATQVEQSWDNQENTKEDQGG
jgi:hypothetical protein